MKELRNKDVKFSLLLCFLFFCFLILFPVRAEELETVPTVGKFSYNVQKYTGFNCIVDFLAESIVKFVIKLKSGSKHTDVNLDIYSGWDLIKKKAKELHIQAEKLSVKNIPIELFELTTSNPIYFKKNEKKKNAVIFPVNITLKLNISFDELNRVFNNLQRDESSLSEIKLPIPPFGFARIKLDNLEVKALENGLIQVSTEARSLENTDSEPLKLLFSGNLIVKDKKIIISNLKSKAEDIFTTDSDMGKAFSEMLEDLINPVFNFHKYEKRGLTIDNVNLVFGVNNLIVEIYSRLLPRQNNGTS